MNDFLRVWLLAFRNPHLIWVVLVWPLLLLPAIVYLLGKAPVVLASSTSTEYADLRLAVYDQGQAADFLEQLHLRKDIQWVQAEPQAFQGLIQRDSLDIALLFDDGFDASIQAGQPAKVSVYLRRGSDRNYERLLRSLKEYDQRLVRMRLEALGGDESILQTTEVEPVYVGESTERIRQGLSLGIPLLGLLFALLACLHASTTLFIRRSRETSSVFVRSMAVADIGFTAGLFTWIGLYTAMRLSAGMFSMPGMLWKSGLNAYSIGFALLLLLAFCLFASACLLLITRRWRKRRQIFWVSRISVLLLLLLFGFGVLQPQSEWPIWLLFVPVSNIALMLREVFLQAADVLHIVLTASVMILPLFGAYAIQKR